MPLPDLSAIEREVAASWVHSGLTARLAARHANAPVWPLATAPLPACGVPGMHQAGPRTIGDVYARFKAMRGYLVPSLTWLDCHDFGVEISVAGELGLAGRAGIKSYGTGPFIARCRESVLRHGAAWQSLASRLGWLGDATAARRTTDAGHIEHVWQSLVQLYEAGLLFRTRLAGPYCPRCQVRLAEHELRRPGVHRTVKTSALVVRLRLTEVPAGVNACLAGADLLAWTTAPWQLAAATCVAAEAGESYAIARRSGHDERVVIAASRLYRVLDDGWHVIAAVPARELAGASCELAFPRGDVRTGPVVLVRSSRAAADLAEPGSIGPDGRFGPALPLLSGEFFADAGRAIAIDLADRGLLFASMPWQSRQPHCWRCGSPLLDRALRSWYLHLGAGQDWVLSHTRYWGAPLPLWECPDGHLTWVSSLAELSELAGRDLSGLDPHYQALATILVKCTGCGGQATWTGETVAADFDNGLMAFERIERFERFGQAGQVGGAGLLVAGDRSWQQVTAAIGRLRQGAEPHPVPLWSGRILDERGRAMDRRLGNVASPLPLADKHGADALRWHFASLTQRQASTRVTDEAVRLVARRVLRRYLHIVAWFSQNSQPRPAAGTRVAAGSCGDSPGVLDRWLLSELQLLVRDVTAAFETFRCDEAAARLESFLRDLSRWYLRLTRRKFGDPADRPHSGSVRTLGSCLGVLTRLMAPLAPFTTDYAWGLIRTCGAPDSVHLTPWPAPRDQLLYPELDAQMTVARQVVRAGRAARAYAQMQARQPLGLAWISPASHAALDRELLALVAAELNVKSIEQGTFRGRRVELDLTVTPELRREALARHCVRVLQDARKRAGLAMTDQISVRWQTTDEDLAVALTEHDSAIRRAVGATSCTRVHPVGHPPASAATPDVTATLTAAITSTGTAAPAAARASGVPTDAAERVEQAVGGLNAVFWIEPLASSARSVAHHR